MRFMRPAPVEKQKKPLGKGQILPVQNISILSPLTKGCFLFGHLQKTLTIKNLSEHDNSF